MDSSDLRRSADALWAPLVGHRFPAAMADVSLPPEAFRWYVTQNLLYLPDYARALALGCAGAQTEEDLARFARAVTNIVEVEIPQNRTLLARVQELCERPPVPGEDVAAPTTRAYATWLLDVAGRGEAALAYAAILPCAWSYGDIGRALVGQVRPHPVYAAWISFFASADYAAVVADLRAATDRALLAAPAPLAEEATEVFAAACRLELGFWDAPPWEAARSGQASGAPSWTVV